MPGPTVNALLYLLDAAFDGDRASLLANLRSVTAADWEWSPPGGARTIAQIFWHVAASKYMYDHYAFGDGVWTWPEATFGKAPFPPDPAFAGNPVPPMDEAISWATEGKRGLRQSIAALDDGALAVPRLTNWRELKETRWIIKVMIEHDYYHAGEINHIRALRQKNDAWPW